MNHHVHILLLGKILKNSQKLVLKKCGFFRKIRNTTEEKLDWKCSTCRRKFRGKCKAGSHIAQSSCKRKSATVEFIGVKNEPPKNIYQSLKSINI